MHINLELLECVYLVSAMLLEIPYMAAHEFDARRRMISKQFHHQLRVGERQPLLGEWEKEERRDANQLLISVMRITSLCLSLCPPQVPLRAWGSTLWPPARPWRWATGKPAIPSSSTRRWTAKCGICSQKPSVCGKCSSGRDSMLDIILASFTFKLN